MKKRVLVAALALTLPLVLYGVPYAYASTTSSSYLNFNHSGTNNAQVHCNSGDYATGGGGSDDFGLKITSPAVWDGTSYTIDNTNGHTPNAWYAGGQVNSVNVDVWVVCQKPITIAGVTVPEFGQLYLAIALGALVYFLLARRYASTKPFSVRPS